MVIASLLSYCCLNFYHVTEGVTLSSPFTHTTVLLHSLQLVCEASLTHPLKILREEDIREPTVTLLLEPGSVLILSGEPFLGAQLTPESRGTN